jgi:ribosomal protein S12 methylthiotransferase
MNDIKIGIVSLGCAKNTVDTEMMMGILSREGFNFVQKPQDAQVIIINTCGFINDAKKESIDTIFEMSEYKKKTGVRGIVVTGCLSKRYKELLFKDLPEADVFLGTENYHKIVQAVTAAYNGERKMFFDDASIDYTPQDRVLTTNPHSAYIKIAEGCNNRCSYCAIPFIRGDFRSRSYESVLEEAEYLVSIGVKEITLIAQDTTKYGRDIYGKACLAELLKKVSDVNGVKWLRVLYSYPEGITDEVLDVIYKTPNICNYIDMPIQHFSNRVLKMMNRQNTFESVMGLIKKIRSNYPEMILRTTLMVGFPSEDQEDFEILKKSVIKARFDRLGVFKFSKEEDTKAYEFDETVSEEEKGTRHKEIMDIQKEISYKKNQERVSKTYSVLIDEYDEDIFMYLGRSFEIAPESDGKIYVASKSQLEIGSFYDVVINKAEYHDLMGEAR